MPCYQTLRVERIDVGQLNHTIVTGSSEAVTRLRFPRNMAYIPPNLRIVTHFRLSGAYLASLFVNNDIDIKYCVELNTTTLTRKLISPYMIYYIHTLVRNSDNIYTIFG